MAIHCVVGSLTLTTTYASVVVGYRHVEPGLGIFNCSELDVAGGGGGLRVPKQGHLAGCLALVDPDCEGAFVVAV